MTWYNITDWLGIIPILMAMIYGFYRIYSVNKKEKHI